MRIFKMKDVELIETYLHDGLTVEVEWKSPYERKTKIGIVKSVRCDCLIFTSLDCIYTGIDKLIEIRTA